MRKLEIKSLNCSYGFENGREVCPVKNLSFTLEAGKIYQLKGNNGSGKSTVLNALLGVIPGQTGTFCLLGDSRSEASYEGQIKTLRDFVDSMFYVPQLTHLMFPTKTCALTYLRLMDKDGRSITKLKEEHDIFKYLLSEIQWRHTEHISGGQRQLLALFAMYVSDAKIVLLDEPTSDISVANSKVAINLIKNYKDESKIVLIATHCTQLEEIVDEVIKVG